MMAFGQQQQASEMRTVEHRGLKTHVDVVPSLKNMVDAWIRIEGFIEASVAKLISWRRSTPGHYRWISWPG
jgi:hypothetical protein